MVRQYEIAQVREFVFEREDRPVLGTQYRCIRCNSATKQLRLKGVFTDLSTQEKSKFKKRYNAMHFRHKQTCRVQSKSGSDEVTEPADGVGCVDKGDTSEASMVREARVSGEEDHGDCGDKSDEAGEDDGDEGEDMPFDLPEPKAPDQLNPRAISTWNATCVTACLQHYGSVPATILNMRVIPRQGSVGNPLVHCEFQNPHGSKTLHISSTCLYHTPGLRHQYLLAEEQLRREERQERGALLDMFERAFSANPASLHAALNELLRE